MKGRLRKHSTNKYHAYIYDVAIGSARELAPSEIQCTDSTAHLLKGSLMMKNGWIDKSQFEEGYCQAKKYVHTPSKDTISIYADLLNV